MVSENSRRIAKNTILLYVRTFISQLIALYTSRKILEILGVEDYGIYNVVGGVVGMLTFLNGSMAVATQRYLTVELGKNDLQAYNRVFCISCIIHVILASLIVIAAETVGLWFVNTQLNIPAGRMSAANWVYQLSIISVFVGIIQTPYMASLTAHERLDIYAYVGIWEAVSKLIIVLLLWLVSFDKLIVYAILVLCVQLLSATVYRMYCLKHFTECKYTWQWNRKLFRSLIGFTGWNLFGTIAWILKDQGANMLLNIFGGPVINAARGVSYQVSGAVQVLVNGFGTAVNPQLTKNYAVGDRIGLHKLFMSSSKISFFFFLLIALPVMIEISYILQLWLVEVPVYTTLFTQLVLLETLCSTLNGIMITSLLSTGNIKWYQIVVGSVMLLNIPLSYIFLRLGFPIIIPFIVSIVITILSFGLRLLFCKYQIGLSITSYLQMVVLPILIVFPLSAILPVVVHKMMEEGLLRLLLVLVTGGCSVCLCAYFIGLSQTERLFVRMTVCNQIKRFKK